MEKDIGLVDLATEIVKNRCFIHVATEIVNKCFMDLAEIFKTKIVHIILKSNSTKNSVNSVSLRKKQQLHAFLR